MLLMQDAGAIELLSQETGDAVATVVCDGEDSTIRYLCECLPALLVIEVAPGAAGDGAAFVRRAHIASPRTYLLWYCDLTPVTCDCLVAAGREGLDAVAFRGRADLRIHVQRGLEFHRDRWSAASVSEQLIPSLHAVAAPVAAIVVIHASRGPNVDQVARLLGTTPRTLERRFEDAELPSPSGLIKSTRWLCAAHALRETRMTARQAAVAMGFPSTRAMRSAMRRALRLPPGQCSLSKAYGVLIESILSRYGGGVHEGSQSPGGGAMSSWMAAVEP